MKIQDESWKDEWLEMPEFVQEKQRPYAQIVVRFDSEDDLQEFATLINQKLTRKTKSIWHPYKSHRHNNLQSLRYKDES